MTTSAHTSNFLSKYREKIGNSLMFYDRIEDMSREDLLGLVGWMMEDQKRQRSELESLVGFERLLRRSVDKQRRLPSRHPTPQV